MRLTGSSIIGGRATFKFEFSRYIPGYMSTARVFLKLQYTGNEVTPKYTICKVLTVSWRCGHSRCRFAAAIQKERGCTELSVAKKHSKL